MPVVIDSANVYAEYTEGDLIETYEDDWGIHNVYEITDFYILNRSDVPHRFSCDDIHGRERATILQGGEDLSMKLPPPQRIDSYPLVVRYSMV